MGGRSSIRNLGTRYAVVTGTHFMALPLPQQKQVPIVIELWQLVRFDNHRDNDCKAYSC